MARGRCQERTGALTCPPEGSDAIRPIAWKAFCVRKRDDPNGALVQDKDDGVREACEKRPARPLVERVGRKSLRRAGHSTEERVDRTEQLVAQSGALVFVPLRQPRGVPRVLQARGSCRAAAAFRKLLSDLPSHLRPRRTLGFAAYDRVDPSANFRRPCSVVAGRWLAVFLKAQD